MKPKNRRDVKLPILHIEIEDADGLRVYDPNGLIMGRVMALNNAQDALLVKPIPGLFSEISGNPAAYYRADDFELRLSPEEMYRLIEHDLRPEEFRYLIDTYGVAHDWHDDFYDSDGTAVQPLRDH